MKHLFVAILFFATIYANAQFIDDFSDNNFTTNPEWIGETSKFQISTSSAIPANMRPGLQSSNNIADTSYISSNYSLQLNDSLEWSFWAKMSFNPTSGNYARFYILADKENLKSPLNGYYISLSYEGTDRLHLVRQDGETHTPIIIGTVANLNKSTNELRIKVKYNSGEWELYSDTLASDNWSLEGNTTDNTYNTGSHLGILCRYTASNASKIYFDDFYAGKIQRDTIPPTVKLIEVISAFQLNIYFSETVNSITAENATNYFINENIGTPSKAELDYLDPTLIHLTLTNPIIDEKPYKIFISGIEDLSENLIVSDSFNIAFYIPQAYDVVINEIMIDPSPVVMLPEYEYIELYNTTNLPINLNNYTLKIGTTKKTIENIVIEPNSYLLLCGDNAKSNLLPYGKVFSFPSFSIPNSSADISLISPAKAVLSFVQFTDTWYDDNFKKDGGWSIEQIDPFNPCIGRENWKASVSNFGGTPGSINSVNNINLDIVSPELLRVALVDDSTIRVFFSEPMDSSLVLNPYRYKLSNNLEIIGIPEGFAPLYNSVILKLNQKISSNIIYSLTVSDTLKDCVGNTMNIGSSVNFAISDSIEVGDIVINEILADPSEGVSDFVEIINRSNKILDMRFLTIATLNSTFALDGQKYIVPNGYILFPGEIVAITKDKSALLLHYYSENPNNVLEISEMPAYANERGTVVLAMASGTIIDKVVYSPDMHDPMLTSTDGVSIERIDYNRPSDEISNWHSAASSVGFATPAYKNSHYLETSDNGLISLSSEVFSPDNDGYNDVLNINYSLDQNGLFCNMQIFDDKGRLIKTLAKNEALGTEGSISWNGSDNDNQKAAFGIYIIFTELYSLNGYSKKIKTAVVLGGKL